MAVTSFMAAPQFAADLSFALDQSGGAVLAIEQPGCSNRLTVGLSPRCGGAFDSVSRSDLIAGRLDGLQRAHWHAVRIG
jgi:hypothetical protein